MELQTLFRSPIWNSLNAQCSEDALLLASPFVSIAKLPNVEVGGTSLFVSPRSSTSAIRVAEPRYTGYQRSCVLLPMEFLLPRPAFPRIVQTQWVFDMRYIIAEMN